MVTDDGPRSLGRVTIVLVPGVRTWWLAVALGGAAAALGVGGWRARRSAVGGVLAASAVLACGAGVALGWGAATGYVPDAHAVALLLRSRLPMPAALPEGSQAEPPHPTSATRGATWRVRIPATASGVGDRYAWVHVPPGYDQEPGRRYPVVYLWHGSPGTGADWFAAGEVDRTVDALVAGDRLAATIVVAPDLGLGLDQEPLDRPGGAQLATFATRDVVGWADDHLRTVPDAGHRVLGGMSAGAYGALVVGVQRPDLFGAVVGVLPYERPSEDDLRQGAAGGAPSTPAAAIDAAHDAGLDPVPVYLVAASKDDPDAARALGRTLRAAHHDVRALVRPGHHDWRFAREQVGPGLVWAEQALGLAPSPVSAPRDARRGT
ncbi:hypothetical protein KDY119_00517 [Luteimicrobium xylanilyticum]|uniref:Endo-1,4-beta-xylanase n=1 Tax=Luteimicrobium xylanilyticum TaxID=1133546 RepID=A0A5P9Q6J5_9MICO|nr:alpha/beta hydrolase-fold protein [Luteimicrobium xylanilyticum]QFU97024.1 hypothetical protein KDY119_00517 [Luteimicrobium xylanilyticum]